MSKRPYEKPLIPINPTLGLRPPAGVPFLAKCPGCGLTMAVKVQPTNIQFQVQINSDPDEISRIKKTKGAQYVGQIT